MGTDNWILENESCEPAFTDQGTTSKIHTVTHYAYDGQDGIYTARNWNLYSKNMIPLVALPLLYDKVFKRIIVASTNAPIFRCLQSSQLWSKVPQTLQKDSSDFSGMFGNSVH